MKTLIKREPDEIDRLILSLFKSGMSTKEVSREAKVSTRNIYFRIAVMKKHYGCKNRDELHEKVK